MGDADFLKEAIELSKESIAQGGFPVGAIVVMDGKIIGRGISNGKLLLDATSHAEIAAIRDASQAIGKRNLTGATVYSSLEPCLMCFSTLYWAGISRVCYACPKQSVSKQHYEGPHNLHEINARNHRQIEIVHLSECEMEARDIIEQWERGQNESAKN